MSVFAPLVLIGPLMLLATAVVALWQHGPLGWLASVLLVAAVTAVTVWAVRRVRRWWHSTLAPERPSVRPADRRR